MPYKDDVFSSIVDMAICGSCGELVRRENMVERSHRFRGAFITQIVCKERCAQEAPCPGSFSGVHGEIEDLNDLEEQGWFLTSLTQPWWLTEARIEPTQYGRIGRCVYCGEWQVWNVAKQAWRDPDLIW